MTMYQSGVKILPDQTGLNQSLDRLNQTRLGMLQQDIAQTQQGIDEFKQIVDKSFTPVYGKYQEEYLKERESFLKEAAQIYQKSNGRLNQKEYMDVSGKMQGLADFANTANMVRKAYTDSVMKVSADTSGKFKRTETLNALKAIEGMSNPHDALDYLESGSWIVAAPPDIDITKIAKGISDNIKQKTGKVNLRGDGSAITTEGEAVDLKAAQSAAEQYWKTNPSLHEGYTENAFVNGIMGQISPGWEREKSYTKGHAPKTPTQTDIDAQSRKIPFMNNERLIPGKSIPPDEVFKDETGAEVGNVIGSWHFPLEVNQVEIPAFKVGSKTVNDAIVNEVFVVNGKDGKKAYARVAIPELADKEWDEIGAYMGMDAKTLTQLKAMNMLMTKTFGIDRRSKGTLIVPFENAVKAAVLNDGKLKGQNVLEGYNELLNNATDDYEKYFR